MHNLYKKIKMILSLFCSLFCIQLILVSCASNANVAELLYKDKLIVGFNCENIDKNFKYEVYNYSVGQKLNSVNCPLLSKYNYEMQLISTLATNLNVSIELRQYKSLSEVLSLINNNQIDIAIGNISESESIIRDYNTSFSYKNKHLYCLTNITNDNMITMNNIDFSKTIVSNEISPIYKEIIDNYASRKETSIVYSDDSSMITQWLNDNEVLFHYYLCYFDNAKKIAKDNDNLYIYRLNDIIDTQQIMILRKNTKNLSMLVNDLIINDVGIVNDD